MMHTLQLDYQPRHWSAYPVGMAIMVAALIACMLVFGRYAVTSSEVKSQESQWQSSRHGLNESNGDSKSSPEKIEQLKPELKHANEVVQQLALPWDNLFKAIEVFNPNQVALLRIETDMSRNTVTIAAESKDFNAMLGYVKSLNRQSSLKDVYLTDHQVQEHDVQRPVRFTISAVWLIDKS